jgi:hypothetical protein
MRFKKYVLLLVVGGLAIAPVGSYAGKLESPSTAITEQATQTQTPAVASAVAPTRPSTIHQLTLKFKPVLAYLAGMAALASVPYLHDRSIVVGHEGSHVAVALLGGYMGGLYVSPKFWGGAAMGHNCPIGSPMHGLIAIAGPLGGINAYLAWLNIWNVAMRYWKSGNVKESIIEGIRDPLFNTDSSLLAIGGTFYGIYQHYINNMIPSSNCLLDTSYGPLADTVQGNDAVAVQQALANIAPFLAKAYPFIAYAGLAGLIGYGVYGLYVTAKAKMKAENPTWW